MGEAEEFRKALISIAKKVKQKPEMTEGDVYSCFVDEGFFRALDYEVGIDARAQERIGAQYADYDCVDDMEQSIFILEAKKPAEEDLLAYRDKQLKEKYVLPKKSCYGVLTNGHTFYLFKREGERLIDELKIEDLASITEKQALEIYSRLKKPSYEYTDLVKILEDISEIEPKPLSEEINRKSFYEIFQLRQEGDAPPTKFTRLVLQLMNVFDKLMEERKSEFLEGAYKFWLRSYAHKPSKIPENWRKLERFRKGIDDETLSKFMFCLETAHNIVAKLILAKVCEDFGIKDVNALEKLENYMSLEFGKGRINAVAYPFAVKKTFEVLRNSLVESVFEDDIFDWWMDCSRLTGESVAEWRAYSDSTVLLFGESLARVFFALRTFDFSGVKEDLLGELYQHYFDPETRKALGEFYTPIEVVDYILDAVEYKNSKILNQRILDPACGSGTFAVEALKRYLHASKEAQNSSPEYWCTTLKNLCDKPKIIALDINPFACLMAQIRFMMEIVPYYKLAKEENPDFVLTTIPIFRTDSLEDERKTGRMQTQIGEFRGDVVFSMDLPILENESKFYKLKLRIPSWDKLRELLGNKDEYFLALRLAFKAIKKKRRKESYEITVNELIEEFQNGNIKGAEQLASIIHEYAEMILTQIKHLVQVWKDGRLVKSIEDLVLAGVLKNFFWYDYVVGNPPYVRVQTLSLESKEKYAVYTTVTGNYDIYIPFIERGISWLSDDGKFGYINPNRFATVNYGKGIREYILKQTNLLEFLDFRDTGVFKDALNYPVILVLSKRKDGRRPLLKVCRMIKKPLAKSDKEILVAIKQNLEQINSIKDYYSNEFFDVFGFNSDLLSTDGWYLMPSKELAVYQKLQEIPFTLRGASKTKKSESALSEGSSTGAKEIYVVEKVIDADKNSVLVKSHYDNKQYKIERALLKQYIEDAGKWHPKNTNDLLIFPYRKSNETYELIPETELRENYPLGWAYLNSKKDSLLKRKDIKNKEQWYAYSAPRSLDYYEEEKILVQGFSIYSSASIDIDGSLFFGPDIYGLRIKDEYRDKALLLLAIINSNITNFYIRHVGVVHGSGYYKFEDRFIKRLPIKLPQTKSEQKLADEITEKVEQILSLAKVEQKVQSFPEPYFEELKEEIEEWDPIEHRAKRSYKSLEPKVEEGAIVLGKGDEIGDSEINSEPKRKYVIEALKGKTISKDKEVKIKLPRSDGVIKKMLERLEKEKAKLEEKSIAELEKEIGERVYRLYGLDANDVKVIEEFLRKF